MTPSESQFLGKMSAEANAGGHIWPDYAACEAALESDFGASQLATKYHNWFGMKEHKHSITNEVINLPTHEVLDGRWIPTTANWEVYDTDAECFQDRMLTLKRLVPIYQHYAAALTATNGEAYVTEVSKTWSSDPRRGAKVLKIYQEWQELK